MSLDKITTLDAAESWCIDQFVDAADKPGAAFRWINLITQDQDGGATGRIMVLRAFAPKTRQLTFWTDIRSPKVSQIRARNISSFVAFDPDQQIQFRAQGLCAVITDGATWQTALDTARKRSLNDYATIEAPGDPIRDQLVETDISQADKHFAMIVFTMQSLDALSLSRQGHRRAYFDWRSTPPHRNWKVP